MLYLCMEFKTTNYDSEVANNLYVVNVVDYKANSQVIKTFKSKVSYSRVYNKAVNFCIGSDLRTFVLENVADAVESHLESWKERYAEYGGNESRLREDLYTNHDFSLEVENAEEVLKRKLNDYEIESYKKRFNKAVILAWKNK